MMDTLLKDINLDFKFTIYKVQAFSANDGIMYCVPGSMPVQDALNKSGDNMGKYLQTLAQDDPQKLREIQNNYCLSNAGYAVATYLLAIGDRHLENLMIKDDGRMWHLDFGFILGKNPNKLKSFVPPIRLNKNMLTGIGATNSENFKIFKQKTIDAFLFLRNYRNLMLNTLFLMVDARIPDLPIDNY